MMNYPTMPPIVPKPDLEPAEPEKKTSLQMEKEGLEQGFDEESATFMDDEIDREKKEKPQA